jgi:hypothetical protein
LRIGTLRAWQGKVLSLFHRTAALKHGASQQRLQLQQCLAVNDRRSRHAQSAARGALEHPLRYFQAAQTFNPIVTTAHRNPSVAVDDLIDPHRTAVPWMPSVKDLARRDAMGV